LPLYFDVEVLFKRGFDDPLKLDGSVQRQASILIGTLSVQVAFLGDSALDSDRFLLASWH